MATLAGPILFQLCVPLLLTMAAPVARTKSTAPLAIKTGAQEPADFPSDSSTTVLPPDAEKQGREYLHRYPAHRSQILWIQQHRGCSKTYSENSHSRRRGEGVREAPPDTQLKEEPSNPSPDHDGNEQLAPDGGHYKSGKLSFAELTGPDYLASSLANADSKTGLPKEFVRSPQGTTFETQHTDNSEGSGKKEESGSRSTRRDTLDVGLKYRKPATDGALPQRLRRQKGGSDASSDAESDSGNHEGRIDPGSVFPTDPRVDDRSSSDSSSVDYRSAEASVHPRKHQSQRGSLQRGLPGIEHANVNSPDRSYANQEGSTKNDYGEWHHLRQSTGREVKSTSIADTTTRSWGA